MSQTTPTPGTIQPDALYTLAAVQDIAGLGPAAIREARKAGLPIHLQGRKGFILGKNLIDHIVQRGRVMVGPQASTRNR